MAERGRACRQTAREGNNQQASRFLQVYIHRRHGERPDRGLGQGPTVPPNARHQPGRRHGGPGRRPGRRPDRQEPHPDADVIVRPARRAESGRSEAGNLAAKSEASEAGAGLVAVAACDPQQIFVRFSKHADLSSNDKQ